MGRVVRNGKGPSARDYAISVGGENVLMFFFFGCWINLRFVSLLFVFRGDLWVL